jgi:hypothetical protein
VIEATIARVSLKCPPRIKRFEICGSRSAFSFSHFLLGSLDADSIPTKLSPSGFQNVRSSGSVHLIEIPAKATVHNGLRDLDFIDFFGKH